MGSTFPVEMSLDVIKDKDDTLFVAFMRDISDEVKNEEEYITFWTESKAFSNMLRTQFMHMWKHSKPIETKIKH